MAKLININDKVLECACGTGAISIYIAKKAKRLVATDYSVGMLRQARKKLSSFSNVRLAKADITKLKYADNSFDKVVAGNVIHLLPEPKAALQELTRVCKPGGRLVIPTYINDTKSTNKAAVRFLENWAPISSSSLTKTRTASSFRKWVTQTSSIILWRDGWHAI